MRASSLSLFGIRTPLGRIDYRFHYVLRGTAGRRDEPHALPRAAIQRAPADEDIPDGLRRLARVDQSQVEIVPLIYDPRMVVRLLLYAYCKGVAGSRKIERATHESVPFRVIAANQ